MHVIKALIYAVCEVCLHMEFAKRVTEDDPTVFCHNHVPSHGGNAA